MKDLTGHGRWMGVGLMPRLGALENRETGVGLIQMEGDGDVDEHLTQGV